MRTGRGAHLRRGALVAAALAALLSGCTGGDGSGSGEPTGQDGAAGPVLGVKIDNVRPARPPTGVEDADVVYVERVEAGLSRLLAVYVGEPPSLVGPVRSARESDLELLRQFDRPTLAYSGAQAKLRPLIDRSGVKALPQGEAPDAYVRDADRLAPHNLYLRPGSIDGPGPDGDLGDVSAQTGFRFGARPAGGTADTAHSVRYPAARFDFSWSAAEDRWLISMDGVRSTTAKGKALGAPTVVVQYVKITDSRFGDKWGNVTPYTETVGSGTALVLRDGRAYDARWERQDPQDGTDFTTRDDEPLPFARGPVWVVYAPTP